MVYSRKRGGINIQIKRSKQAMTLRYIFHSGFLLETERSILIFDYWMDPANVMKPYIDPSGSKHIYVFASHFHEDHFTKEIFKWRQNNPFTAYTYILSKDILKRRRAHREDADVWMAKAPYGKTRT